MEAYGAAIAAELAGAEADLAAPHARPFAGLSSDVMSDVERLRADQLEIFRRHVSIEQQYRVPRPGADTADVRNISFSSIAGSMRDKEIATGNLLDRLDKFDLDLRKVIGKFEASGDDPHEDTNDGAEEQGHDGDADELRMADPLQGPVTTRD
jgi:hypothetical protein